MTRWKGTLRSINSAMNAAQREAVRRKRELERQQKQAARMAEQQRAAYEVAVFENAVEVLVSVHKQRRLDRLVRRPKDFERLWDVAERQGVFIAS